MQQRSPIAAALLSFFIPFYVLYWFYDTGKIMEQRGVKVPRFILLVGPIIGLLLLTVLSGASRASGPVGDATVNIISILGGTLAVIAAVLLPYIYYYQFADAADKASAGKASKVVSFLLFIFISPAGVYVIQDALNTIGQGPVLPGSQTPLPPTFSGPPANPYQ